MATPEGNVKAKVKEYLKSLGDDLWYFMPVPFGYGIKGIPDFVCCYHGHFIGIETKAKGGKPTPWQIRIAGFIQRAGGISLIAYGVEDIKETFEALGAK